jgi:hypothetical protein
MSADGIAAVNGNARSVRGEGFPRIRKADLRVFVTSLRERSLSEG